MALGVLGTGGAGVLRGVLPSLEEGLTGDVMVSFDPREDLPAFFFVVVVFEVPFSLGLGLFLKDRKLSLSESTSKETQLNSRQKIHLALYRFFIEVERHNLTLCKIECEVTNWAK